MKDQLKFGSSISITTPQNEEISAPSLANHSNQAIAMGGMSQVSQKKYIHCIKDTQIYQYISIVVGHRHIYQHTQSIASLLSILLLLLWIGTNLPQYMRNLSKV